MSFCKYCPTGFQSTVERDEHERECPRRASPAPEGQGGDARELAQRVVNAYEANGMGNSPILELVLARAVLGEAK